MTGENSLKEGVARREMVGQEKTDLQPGKAASVYQHPRGHSSELVPILTAGSAWSLEGTGLWQWSSPALINSAR